MSCHSSESELSSTASNHLSTSGESATSGSKGSEDIDGIKHQLSRKETTAVFRLRLTVILVLVLAASGISLTVYRLTRNAEIDEFELQYEGSASKVLESFNSIFVQMGAISGLGVAATAHARDHESAFPFLTLSNFQERAGNAMALSKALYVSINPLVFHEQLSEWEEYVSGENNKWIDDGHAYQQSLGVDDFEDPKIFEPSWLTNEKVDPPHAYNDLNEPSEEVGPGPYFLRWQTSPVLKSSAVNENVLQNSVEAEHARECFVSEAAVLSGFVYGPPGDSSSENRLTSFFATLRSIKEGKHIDYPGDPMSFLNIPVFDSFDPTTRKAVAVMTSVIHWRQYLRFLLPSNTNGLTVVVENLCDGNFTYEIHGEEARALGLGDLHDRKFEKYQRQGTFTLDHLEDGTEGGIELKKDGCPYDVHMYPTQYYYDSFVTNTPIVITFAVAMVFTFTVLMFFAYDGLVERRQTLILAKATQSTAIVSSLFPKQVRDRLLQTDVEKGGKGGSLALAQNHRLKTFLNGDNNANDNGSQPIADLFPHCTVFFGDIAGFTAWSSSREPAQVFILLQAVYQSFDSLAKRRRVFKVETIGDSYVAVTGLPEPQSNHAVIMARFAWECLLKMNEITKELEVTLGPDTGDLGMRFGLHSGPVTAGVLRGDRARFQLFGDTVNTASRMESTGVRNKIQVSQATATYLNSAGKTHWLKPREDMVAAKGKGVLNTFWLRPGSKGHGSSSSVSSGDEEHEDAHIPTSLDEKDRDAKMGRLVDWMVELLVDHIKKIIAVREATPNKSKNTDVVEDVTYQPPLGITCLDEAKEVMAMPKFNAATAAAAFRDHQNVVINPNVILELREYVTLIASTYRSNPFHNFEHACHVTMSVNKLLKRIVAPDLSGEQMELAKQGERYLASQLHDFSHGIISDPMTLFAITFSGLIHDVDHRGCSNLQLIKEEPDMGILYRNKSVAEQNSLDTAWELLMFEQFTELRRLVFGTQEELLRFRQLIVNIVLATDIFDKELNDLRKLRWEHAFSANQPGEDVNDFRATIVMEHIIQASDVSHTMQHWHVYQKWNKHLFEELYRAYHAGRLGADPSTFWYQGELGFFDNYIIPLAKKLKECNVFGVSSDEYLNYAVLNRAEWEQRGKDVVNELVANLEKESLSSGSSD